MRTRATVAGLTSSAAPMAASVQPGPASPWLAFNRIRAWVRALAGATPRPIMVCSRARSCSDRTTMCRLRTSASCSGGIPRPHEHETEPHISQVTTDELLVTVGGPPNPAQDVSKEQRFGPARLGVAECRVPGTTAALLVAPADRVVGAHAATLVARLVDHRQHLHTPSRVVVKVVPLIGPGPGRGK